MTQNKQRGFALIEVIIYIGLFSILIGGAFVAAYQLIDGSNRLSATNIIEQEGNFVIRKLNWVLTGVDTTKSITPSSGTSPTLILTKYDGSKVSIKLNTTKIELKDSTNGNAFLPITSDNVRVESLEFIHENSSKGGITAKVVIDGNTFTITKYFR